MTTELTNAPTLRMPLRLWPGVVIVVIQWLIRFGLPLVAPDAEFFGVGTQIVSVIAGPAGLLAILVWWLFFSRARWSERLGAIAVMVLAGVATRPFTHQSIQNGMQGMMFAVYAVPPTLSLALVGWAAASHRQAGRPRWAAMVAAMLLGCGVWMLARTNGIFGGVADLEWRWTPTAEERLLAQGQPLDPSARSGSAPVASAPVVGEHPIPIAAEGGAKAVEHPAAAAATTSKPVVEKTADVVPVPAWPGFRGPDRNSTVHGVRIDTDWSASPPEELWRRPVGPGWSSFAVHGDRLYTQEQRGDDEIVACYSLATGTPVWMHRDATRFWESNGGAGPRATPTLSGDRVYAFGATGILNALDAGTGAVVWSRNVPSDTGVPIPGWGFAGSPLVVGEVVIVAASGALVGHEAATGERRWFVKSRGGGYSSPHLLTVNGVVQVLLMGGAGATSVAPVDGTVLWEHPWPGAPMVQPAVLGGGDVLLTTADAMGGLGTRRVAITQKSDRWDVEERWTSRALKPFFNDYTVHKGHVFGFDGSILACVDLADGQRKWKGGRYGNGQLVLLPDQDLLLVLSEEGELALVKATPDQFTEVARFPALDGKTWNHPVLVGDILLVRNGEEMAAFRLSLLGR